MKFNSNFKRFFWFILGFILLKSVHGFSQGLLKDQSGNTYKTIRIGNRIWMAENFRATHYSNGERINFIRSPLGNISKDSPKENGYTKLTNGQYLYTWAILQDARGIAPPGWHVATPEDWNNLIINCKSSKDIKSVSGWMPFKSEGRYERVRCPRCIEWSAEYRRKVGCNTCYDNQYVKGKFIPEVLYSMNGNGRYQLNIKPLGYYQKGKYYHQGKYGNSNIFLMFSERFWTSRLDYSSGNFSAYIFDLWTFKIISEYHSEFMLPIRLVKDDNDFKELGNSASIGVDRGVVKSFSKEFQYVEPSAEKLIEKPVSTPSNSVIVAGEYERGAKLNQLDGPNIGLFVDRQENVYVVDKNNHRIQRWAKGSTKGVTIMGGNGSGSLASQLNYPEGIFLDESKDIIYVADSGNNRILSFNLGVKNGVTVFESQHLIDPLKEKEVPIGLFVDSNDDIYFTDILNSRVRKYQRSENKWTTVAGGNGIGKASNQFNEPYGVFVDANQNVYVADRGNHRVQKWLPGSKSGITVAGGNGRGGAANQLDYPSGIFIDKNGDLYISDYGNHRIQRWSPGALSGYTVAKEIFGPKGIFVDSKFNLFVNDEDNNMVLKWTLY